MLLLAYLVTRSQGWSDATIRVLAPQFEQNAEQTLEDLRQKLAEIRIEAQAKVVSDARRETITTYSWDASIVFLPFRLKGNQPLDPIGNPLDLILSELPITGLVLAAEDIDLEAEPEKGKAGETAAALDARTDAEKKVQAAQKDKEAAQKTAIVAKEKLLEQIKAEAANSEKADSEIDALEAAYKEAEKQAEKAARRFAKARAKAETASKVVEDLGVKPSKSDTEADDGSD